MDAVRKLTPNEIEYQRDELKRKLRKDRRLFIRFILGVPIRDFQEVMSVHEGAVREDKIVSMSLLPRGSGKTKVGTVGDSCWEICHDPDIRLQIIAESTTTAKMFLQETQQHLEMNRRLIDLYGHHHNPGKWNTDRFVSAQRKRIEKEPTLEALGIGQGVVGRHVEGQYYDDVSTRNTADTPKKRADMIMWHDTVASKMLEPHCFLRIRGTRYFPGDLYEVLIKRWGEEILYRQPALLGNDEEGYRSFWEERFPVDTLLQQRAANPVAFESQMQNAVALQMSSYINADKIKFCKPSELPDPTELIYYVGVDPAGGDKAENDWFAINEMAFHVVTKQLFNVRNIATRFPDALQMLDALSGVYWEIKERGSLVASMTIENNGLQIILANTLRNAPDYKYLPTIPKNTHHNKGAILISRAHYINRGLITFVEGNGNEHLIEQILRYPSDEVRDDRMDSWFRSLDGHEDGFTGTVGLTNVGIFEQSNQFWLPVGLVGDS